MSSFASVVSAKLNRNKNLFLLLLLVVGVCSYNLAQDYPPYGRYVPTAHFDHVNRPQLTPPPVTLLTDGTGRVAQSACRTPGRPLHRLHGPPCHGWHRSLKWSRRTQRNFDPRRDRPHASRLSFSYSRTFWFARRCGLTNGAGLRRRHAALVFDRGKTAQTWPLVFAAVSWKLFRARDPDRVTRNLRRHRTECTQVSYHSRRLAQQYP
jgi:hypothetical protein